MAQQKAISRLLLSPSIRLSVPVVFLAGLAVKHLVIASVAPSPNSLILCSVGIYYFWAGVILTNVLFAWLKFQVPSVNYPVLFDVGRHFFALADLIGSVFSVHLLFNWTFLFSVVCSPQSLNWFFPNSLAHPQTYTVCQQLNSQSTFPQIWQTASNALSQLFSAYTSNASQHSWLSCMSDSFTKTMNGLNNLGCCYVHLIPPLIVLVEVLLVHPSIFRRANAIVQSGKYPLPYTGTSKGRIAFDHIMAVLLEGVKFAVCLYAGTVALNSLLQ